MNWRNKEQTMSWYAYGSQIFMYLYLYFYLCICICIWIRITNNQLQRQSRGNVSGGSMDHRHFLSPSLNPSLTEAPPHFIDLLHTTAISVNKFWHYLPAFGRWLQIHLCDFFYVWVSFCLLSILTFELFALIFPCSIQTSSFYGF